MKRKLYKKEPQENVACCPIIKVKLEDIDGLEAEAQDRKSYSEHNIDPERRHLNLYVHGIDEHGDPAIDGEKFNVSLYNRINDRIKGAGASIRGDLVPRERKGFQERGHNSKASVVAVGMTLQVSHPLAMSMLKEDGMLDSEGRIKKSGSLPRNGKTFRYFRDSYRWVCGRYGKDNVVGGYIHLDEYTPHMHVFIIPLMSKPVRYRKTECRDADGKTIFKSRLNAKEIFSKQAKKELWKDYAEAVRDYGATAAKGLYEKGDYDEVATMQAVREREEQQAEETIAALAAVEEKLKKERAALAELEMKLGKRLASMKELEKREERARWLIDNVKPVADAYAGIVGQIQKVVDKTKPSVPIAVEGYEIHEEVNTYITQTGETTEHVCRKYIIHCLMGGEKKRVNVSDDDYYKAHDNPVKKAVSRFFFDTVEPAKLAADAHKAILLIKGQQNHGRGL